MALIYLNAGRTLIRSFGGSMKGTKSTVKIELELADPDDLAWLLRELATAQSELKEAMTPKPKAKAKPRQIEQQKPMLALPFYGGDD